MKKLILFIIFALSCNQPDTGYQIIPIIQPAAESTVTDPAPITTTISPAPVTTVQNVYVSNVLIGEFVGFQNGAYIAKTSGGYFIRVNENPFIFGFEYSNGPIYHTTADCSGDFYTDYQKSETIGFFTGGEFMMFYKSEPIIAKTYHYPNEATCYADNTLRFLSRFTLNDPAISGVDQMVFGVVHVE